MHFEKKTNLNQPVSVSVIHDYFHKQPFKNCHHLISHPWISNCSKLKVLHWPLVLINSTFDLIQKLLIL